MDLITVYFLFQVSTHGYSQNQILVWKYPSLVQIAKLTGHTYRVLYLVSLKSFEHFYFSDADFLFLFSANTGKNCLCF